MRFFTNRPKEHFALLTRQDKPNELLAVFINGFRGNYLTTWGKLPELLKEKADADDAFANWDYLFVGYNTKTVLSYLDIASLLCTHWNDASKGNSPFTHAYSKLALLGHSLGTLGIRQCSARGLFNLMV